ncbi:rab9 effector protein with kelch motifs [Gastrophryne carolinensis]
MEFLGVLEPEDTPKELMWYAFSPGGTAPNPRVGHTCIYLAAEEEGGRGKIVIIGGADPGCCYSDAHIINLDTYQWETPEWEGLSPRYEHASFVSSGGSLWVFGGADQAENRNSVQVLNSGHCSWKSPNVKGSIPSPRTFHTSSAAIGDKLFVFGGGEKQADPVADNKLHVFDTANQTWTQPKTTGEPPNPRHGHIIVAVESKIFIHGGMAGSTFFCDMFCLDTETMKWEKLNVKGDVPPACAAHSAVSWEKSVYVFGGMAETGVVNTLHRYDTETHTWTQMTFHSSSPAARLDHSMCLLPWKVRTDTELDNASKKKDFNDSCADQGLNTEPSGKVALCLIFGGMDTNGEIFNDCSVTVLTK